VLALFAGRGGLPEVLLAALEAEGHSVMVLSPWSTREELGGRPARPARLETLGSLLAELRDRGIAEVCFAGGVARPALDPGAIDAATLPLVPRLREALGRGDDGALRVLVEIFEEAGLAVRAAQELVPDLLPPAGVLTRAAPEAADRADAARGAEAVAALGAADLGQACVVAGRVVLALEAAPGTDWMLRSLTEPAPPETVRSESLGLFDPFDLAGSAADWLTGPGAPRRRRDPALPPGGLLFKAPKPGQDRRADLPAIGPSTVRGAAEAGLRGIVIEAGGVLVLDRAETVRAADAAGLFLWVRPHGEGP
jgi:hypothetical protein